MILIYYGVKNVLIRKEKSWHMFVYSIFYQELLLHIFYSLSKHKTLREISWLNE